VGGRHLQLRRMGTPLIEARTTTTPASWATENDPTTTLLCHTLLVTMTDRHDERWPTDAHDIQPG
jgi:hypothetical protein